MKTILRKLLPTIIAIMITGCASIESISKSNFNKIDIDKFVIECKKNEMKTLRTFKTRAIINSYSRKFNSIMQDIKRSIEE